MRRQVEKISLQSETLRYLETVQLSNVHGGSPNESEDGHVCESVNSCPGSVVPYQCATDGVCTTIGPCTVGSVGLCL